MRATRCLLTSLILVLTVCTGAAEGTRWLLVDFGKDAGTTTFGTYNSTWNQVLRHVTYTEYVDPDGNPDHWGIADKVGTAPGNNVTFYGVQGTTAIDMQIPHRIVATFYNKSGSNKTFYSRVTFKDADSPAGAVWEAPWYEMYGDKVVGIGQTVEQYFNIADAVHVDAPLAPPSNGDNFLVNISLTAFNPDIVLTKIELSDEQDTTAPTTPGNLQATATATSAEAGNCVVELTWDASTDSGEGVHRYHVYRDDGTGWALHEMVDPAWTTYWGTGTVVYHDFQTEPNTQYTYGVEALDAEINGMFISSTSDPNSRRGNVSSRATTTITTPSFSMPTLIDATADITYLGKFRVPDTGNWDNIGQGLAYNPNGNPTYDPNTELPGSLYITGRHDEYTIGEFSIAKPILTEDIPSMNQSTMLQNFVALFSWTPSGGNAIWYFCGYHPGGNGVGPHVYGSQYRFYAGPLDEAHLCAFDMDLTTCLGPWHIGDSVAPDKVDFMYSGKFIFPVPQAWADTYTGGRSMFVGNGGHVSGHGMPTAGPSLYAIAPWESGSLPATNGVISDVELLRYGTHDDSWDTWHDNWSYLTRTNDACWAVSGGKQAVIVSGVIARGDTWYGGGDGAESTTSSYDLPPTIVSAKGYNATYQEGSLFLFNPADLARVALGSMTPDEPRAYQTLDVQKNFLLNKNAVGVGNLSIAFDQTNGYLYVHEADGETAGRSLMHVYQIVAGGGGDTTAPAAVSDLAASNPTSSSVDLDWTAPGDDGSSGTATVYDIRYSTSTISEANWSGATPVSGEPTPASAGTPQGMTVGGLSSDTTYYFAIKTADEVPNISAISNVDSATTLTGGGDTTAPDAVTDLAAGGATSSSINLSWTAPGDDGATGTATSYDVRYSTSTIDEGNWAAASQVTGEPAPQVAGSAESMTVSGLSASTTYYFAIKTSDEVPNESAISNSPSGATTAGGGGDDAIAQWKLDENGGTTAGDSAGTSDGTLSGGVSWTTGHDGSGLDFDGVDGQVDGSFTATLDMDGPMSMTLWVWSDITPGTGDSPFGIGPSSGASNIYFYANGDVRRYGDAVVVTPSVRPTSGVWYHLAYTSDGTTHRIYLDGIDRGSSTNPTDTGMVGVFRMGNRVKYGGRPFDGKIDGVRVYDRELSPAEVETIYQGGPTNAAPSVDAGSDDSITLPTDTVNLDGTVSDDGLPDPPGAVTTLWTKDSGPGTVTFGDDTAIDTTATFSTDGTYVLQLEADDSELTATDTVTITVDPAPNTAPSVDAGLDDAITLPTDTVNLDGTVNDDGLPDPPGAVTTLWTKDSGPGTVTFGDDTAIDTTATFSQDGVYVLKLEADDSDLTASDTVTITVDPATGGPTDMIAYWDLNDGSGDTATDVTGHGNDGTVTGATWTTGYYGGALDFDGVDDQVDGSIAGGTISMSGAMSLSAWVYAPDGPDWSDAVVGLSDGSTGQFATVLNTGNVRMYGDAVLVNCTVTPPTGQWYHLCYTTDGTTHLIYLDGVERGTNTATNNAGTANTFRIGNRVQYGGRPLLGKIDDVRVYDRQLSPGEVDALYNGTPVTNAAPTVDAGSDDAITLPTDTVNLDGTVTDDGLPDPPGAFTTLWTKDSGPGTVTFGDDTAIDTTATFSQAGVYVLKLEADDSELTGSDTVTITVNAEPQPTVAFDATSSSGDESVTPASLSVSLSASYSQTVTVDYAVTGGSATGGGGDYTLAAGTLTFDPNDVSKTIDISIVDDGDAESDETVEVTLSNPSNASLGANTVHTYTILDNDGVSPPGQASSPSPASGATKVSRSVILSWTAGSGSDSHDVYFGTNPSPGASEFQGNQPGTTFDPGYLGKNTWHYWRIDEVNAGGTTTGVVWSFRTGSQ